MPFAIKYRLKTATEKDLLDHLTECQEAFTPPLGLSVDLREYSRKLFTKAETFEAWADERLVGLVAAYFNDLQTRTGFIPIVSVARSHMGRGIARELLEMSRRFARKSAFRVIRLEVHNKNAMAIHIYRKFGFIQDGTRGDFLLMKLDVLPLEKET